MADSETNSANQLTFPDGFLWGAATAAHQVEGHNTNNNWWAWEQAGHIHSGDSAAVALDWWHNAEQDFDLAQSLHLNALRLSVEWSRIEPRPGEWDAAALGRYRHMLTALHERGMRPFVTLHHFTNPLWLEERGGWLAPGVTESFTRYVTHVVTALGDLCDFWCTLNEPNIYAIVGYSLGHFPPGKQGDALGTARVMANMARAHAAAYRAIHHIQPQATVGWAQNFNMFDPARPNSPLDRLVTHLRHTVLNDFFLHIVQHGKAPFPLNFVSGDLQMVKGTCDFIGINTYYRDRVRFDLSQPAELFGRHDNPPDVRRSEQPVGDWEWGEVYPQGIGRIAQDLSQRFDKPLYVTESGVADGQDELRPWVIARAVRAMHEAISHGAELRGYFHWTLIDNFEWAEGYAIRFGLIALDLETHQRTPRPSAHLYSHIAQANALTPTMLHPFGPDVVDAAFP